MSNNNNINDLITKVLNSDLIKVILALLIFIATMSWKLSDAKNDITKAINTLEHKIEIQNIQIENRLKNLEEKQDRDFKFIIENFQRKK